MGRLVVRQADPELEISIADQEHERRFRVELAGLDLHVAPPTRIILGIDLGLAMLGWGLVQQVGVGLDYLGSGVVTTKPFARRPDENRIKRRVEVARAERIKALRRGLVEAVHKAAPRSWPDVVAIEALFWSQNVTSAFDLARVGGAIEVWAAEMGIRVVEYGVTDVRKAIAQQGDCDDRLVAAAVARHLHLSGPLSSSHQNDALAVALRHALGEN